MSWCSYKFQTCFYRMNFVYCFKNVMKLKHLVYSARNLQNSGHNFKISYCRKFSYFPPDIPYSFVNGNVKNCYFGNPSYSRWTRYSQRGFFNQNSRKRNEARDTVLTEKLTKKLQHGKLRETKRKVSEKMGEIKENVLTIPNGLCLLRIVAAPVLGYLVLSELYTESLGLFIFAGVTDMVDGYIARNFPNQQSMIGSFLDPAADKLLIATLFITLTVNGLIPVPLTSIIILRDVILMGSGFYIRFVSLPPPKTLSRYFDMSFATAKLSPTTISKANTLVQSFLVASSLAAPVFCYVDHLFLHILWYITATTTVLSAGSYIYYKNSTYKLFTFPDKSKIKK